MQAGAIELLNLPQGRDLEGSRLNAMPPRPSRLTEFKFNLDGTHTPTRETLTDLLPG